MARAWSRLRLGSRVELDKRGTPPGVAPVNIVDGANALLRGHGAPITAMGAGKPADSAAEVQPRLQPLNRRRIPP